MLDLIAGMPVFDHSPRRLFQYFGRKFYSGRRLTDFDEAHPCVFVLSTGRTGTQTLAALLRLSRNVFSYHEPPPGLARLSIASYKGAFDPGQGHALAQGFLSIREDRFRYSLGWGKGYVETSPYSRFLAPAIAEAVPNVRFIHLVRDPRAVVRSGMRIVRRALITPRHSLASSLSISSIKTG